VKNAYVPQYSSKSDEKRLPIRRPIIMERNTKVNKIPVILKHGLTLELSPATIERNTKIAVMIDMTNVVSCSPPRKESFDRLEEAAADTMQAANRANELRVNRARSTLLVRRYSF